jgi:FkbM family methyltransferase
MGINSYAQNFEDVMLWRALGHIENGFYIDVGAQDPVIDSVSKAFYEKGWRGIHVEPTSKYAEMLRHARPDETILQAAVADEIGTITFYEIPETGLSTADVEIANRHRSQFTVVQTSVPCITLAEVFALAKERIVHWLKVDVEGFERQVLAGWGSSQVRPWVVVVESTLPLTTIQSHQQWEAILLGYGYEAVYFDGLNRYYISEQQPELKTAFQAGPNVFDGFTLNGTASAPFCHKLLSDINILTANADSEKTQLIQTTSTDIAALNAKVDLLHKEKQAQQEHKQALVAEHQQKLGSVFELLRYHQTEAQRLLQDQGKQTAVYTQQLGQLQQELNSVLRELVQRERKVAEEQMYTQQNHAEKIQALQLQFVQERQQILASNEQQIADLQKQHQAVLIEVQLEREQLIQNKLQIAAETQLRVSSLEKREQTLAAQLQTAQQQSQRLAQDVRVREQLYQQQIAKQQQAQMSALQQQLQREKEFAQELQTIKLQYDQAHNALRVSIVEKNQLLASNQTERAVLQLQLEQFKKDYELAISDAAQQTNKLTEDLQAAYAELAEQDQKIEQLHKEQTQQLAIFNHSQADWHHLEQSLRIELLTQDQRVLSLQQQLAQAEEQIQSLQAQWQFDQECWQRTCEQLQVELNAELEAELANSQQLRQLLAAAQSELARTKGSFSWWITAPLRFLLPSAKSFAVDARATLDSAGHSAANLPSATNANYTSLSSTFSELTTMSMTASPIPPVQAGNIAELLALHDAHFVASAYQTLLGRSADEAGMTYYLGRVRAGYAKIQIVAQLSRSAEARAYGAQLPGLADAVNAYQRGQWPLLGWIWRSVHGLEGTSAAERRLRRIENQLQIFNAESQLRFSQLEAAINSVQQTIAQPVIHASNVLSQAVNTVATTSEDAAPDGVAQLSGRAAAIYQQLKRAVAQQQGSAA